MAWFVFTDASAETFVFRLDDRAAVAHARNLLAGIETSDPRIGGTVVKTAADYNIGWSYHLDPESIFFFELSTEVGDSTMRYIEDHLDEVGGALLPGNVWTGWSSLLLDELRAVSGGACADRLTGSGRAEILFGRAGDDRLKGAGGDDHLVGGAGADRLRGDAGDDKLAGNAGCDLLSGGRGGDYLDGGGGNDVLKGGAGDDVLAGGKGRDVLEGGAGADRFLFDVAPSRTNADAIADFSVVDDTIALDDAVFKDLTGTGNLAKGAFHIGTAAHDADDRIVYDEHTGALLYDADGTGATAAVRFAAIASHLTALSHLDFEIV